MMRWKLYLGCGHDLASDDIPDFEMAELCPEHGTYERVTGCVAFRDDDIQVTSEELASTGFDPSPLDFDFIDEATGEDHPPTACPTCGSDDPRAALDYILGSSLPDDSKLKAIAMHMRERSDA